MAALRVPSYRYVDDFPVPASHLPGGLENLEQYGRPPSVEKVDLFHPSWAKFASDPSFFYQLCEITFLARIASEAKKLGLLKVSRNELKKTLKTAMEAHR